MLRGTLEENLTASAQAGFQNAGIFENDLIGSALRPQHVRRLMEDAGLSSSLYQPFRDFEDPVLSQTPAMEEMSPYRHLRTPHLTGYVVTGGTRHALSPLHGRGTRLRLQAQTVLRIDPIAYWEPIARIAFHLNVRRVLESAKIEAEGLRIE